MELRLYKASDWNHEEKVVVNTMEELVKLMFKMGHPIIIQEIYVSDTDTYQVGLLVYDDYIE